MEELDEVGKVLALCRYTLDTKNLVKRGLLGKEYFFKAIDLLQVAVLEEELGRLEG